MIFVYVIEGIKGDVVIEVIWNLIKEFEVGDIYMGCVVKMIDFGVFVELK